MSRFEDYSFGEKNEFGWTSLELLMNYPMLQIKYLLQNLEEMKVSKNFLEKKKNLLYQNWNLITYLFNN